MIQSRLERLDQLLSTSALSGIILNAGPSLAYFTGLDFHLMERPVILMLLLGQKPVFILPRLEAAKVAGMEGVEIFFYGEDPLQWPQVFAQAVDAGGAAGERLGVEPLQLRFLEYRLLKEAARDTEFSDATKMLAALRSRKDPEEIALMRRAVDIAQDALRAVLPRISIGMSEEELGSELVLQLFRHGSDADLPFSPIVSSGANGANPHARPSSRRLTAGDLLVIDWGANYRGYVSDLTRTFAVGEIDAESARIHEVVQQANRAGRKAGRSGATCEDVDRAARAVVEEAGYGQYFTHRTGHGLGRQCHEEPYIREGNIEILEEGMTYTVEPGIYLPGKNGVRIEDDVLIDEEGAVSLSSLPRRIIQVG